MNPKTLMAPCAHRNVGGVKRKLLLTKTLNGTWTVTVQNMIGHLIYNFIDDSYRVVIVDNYDGYVGRLIDTTYEGGHSWTDWAFFAGSENEIRKQASKWTDDISVW